MSKAKRRSGGRAAAISIAVLGAMGWAAQVFGQSSWTGADGNSSWSDPGNWSPVGVPTGGTVNFVDTDGVGRTINYDDPSSRLFTLNVDLTDVGGSASNTILISSNTLNLSTENVGTLGAGTINQSGGTQSFVGQNNSLSLGVNVGSIGDYSLSGGSLALAVTTTIQGDEAAGIEEVGQSGVGNFTQTGGSNQIGGASTLELGVLGILELGVNPTGSGVYSLTAGSLTTVRTFGGSGPIHTGSEFVGYNGTGTFIQSGGTNSCTGSQGILYLAAGPGSIGNYTLSGGVLTANNDGSNANVPNGAEIIGYNGIGTFSQSAGSNTLTGAAGNLYLGYNSTAAPPTQQDEFPTPANSTGTYTLSGGTLTAVNEHIGYYGTGTFIQTGGSNTTNNLYLADGPNPAFTVPIQIQVGTYTLMGGTLSVAGTLTFGGVGSQSIGNLILEGGVATIGTTSGRGQNISVTGNVGANTYGDLIITGNYTAGSGSLTLGIGGPASTGGFGHIDVLGTDSSFEKLNVVFLSGFQPAIGDTYDFLTAGNFTGGFSVNSPYPLEVNYSPTGVSLTVVPEPTGIGLLLCGMGLLSRRRGREELVGSAPHA